MRAIFTSRGSFNHMESFLRSMRRMNIERLVEPYAVQGVRALEAATPEDSGATARAWSYEIKSSGGKVTITWTNSNLQNGFPVAVMLQYGYGTGTGGYVQGRDYINPVLKPVFDNIADGVWRVVTSA